LFYGKKHSAIRSHDFKVPLPSPTKKTENNYLFVTINTKDVAATEILFSFKKIIRLLYIKYSLRKRREKSAERKSSMRQTCFILSLIVLLMVIKNSDAATKKNTIAIYPAEDTAATFKG
jgi:hypothetical protein